MAYIGSEFDGRRLYCEICDTLFLLGVPAHLNGYDYLVSAITRVVYDRSCLRAVTKRLYPEVGAEFSRPPQIVERSIRNAIEIAFNRGDPDVLNAYFGMTISADRGKPTNSEFIALVAQRIALKLSDYGAAKAAR